MTCKVFYSVQSSQWPARYSTLYRVHSDLQGILHSTEYTVTCKVFYSVHSDLFYCTEYIMNCRYCTLCTVFYFVQSELHGTAQFTGPQWAAGTVQYSGHSKLRVLYTVCAVKNCSYGTVDTVNCRFCIVYKVKDRNCSMYTVNSARCRNSLTQFKANLTISVYGSSCNYLWFVLTLSIRLNDKK